MAMQPNLLNRITMELRAQTADHPYMAEAVRYASTKYDVSTEERTIERMLKNGRFAMAIEDWLAFEGYRLPQVYSSNFSDLVDQAITKTAHSVR